MTSETTSLAQAPTARAEWSDFADFLRRPRLPERAAPLARGTKGVLRMLALDVMIMAVLLSVLLTVALLGLDLPENSLADLDFGPFEIAAIVLAAPIIEEVMFRSWLSGRPGHVGAVVILGIGFVAVGALTAGGDANALHGAVLAGTLLAAIAVLATLRNRPPMRWFAAIFPVLFWLSTLGFALIHLLNYESGTLAILLPLVLPQFILGAILGYVRVHYGLWAAIALHALHNALVVTVVLSALRFGT